MQQQLLLVEPSSIEVIPFGGLLLMRWDSTFQICQQHELVTTKVILGCMNSFSPGNKHILPWFPVFCALLKTASILPNGVPGDSRNKRGRGISRWRPERTGAQRVGIAWNNLRLALRRFSLRSGRSQGRHHVAGRRYGGSLRDKFRESTGVGWRVWIQTETRSRWRCAPSSTKNRAAWPDFFSDTRSSYTLISFSSVFSDRCRLWRSKPSWRLVWCFVV